MLNCADFADFAGTSGKPLDWRFVCLGLSGLFFPTFELPNNVFELMNELGVSLSRDLRRAVLTSLSLAEIVRGQTYERVILSDEAHPRLQLGGLTFEQAIFDRVDLSESKWSSLEFFEVLLENCTNVNADWSACRLETVEFRRSRLTGTNFAGGNLDDVCLTSCKMDLSILHDSKLSRCRFERCDLREADFQGATLRHVQFRDCDLRNARFPGASFEQVDLRGSQIAGVHIDGSALRGTTVDPAQVADLASLLGLVVRALDE